MPRKGREHFDSYTERTGAKHEILQKYLRVYLAILRTRIDAVHYIDAFAGQGVYGESTPGSPLRAIALRAEMQVPAAVTLIESDAKSFARLAAVIGESKDTQRLRWEPRLIEGEFGSHAASVLSDPIYRECRRVATFAFIDPCGIKGVRLRDIAAVLERPFGECLVLWNYSGIIRWLGVIADTSERPPELEEFFGGQQELERAIAIHLSDLDAEQRESAHRKLFFQSLYRRSGASYFLPFRFEAPDANRTSHYLIHCSGHPLGFRIMKEIMHGESRGADDVGEFGFVTDLGSESLPLFHPHRDDARRAVLEKLQDGMQPVTLFFDDWVNRPDDYMTTKQYKEILLELEKEGLVEVVDPVTGAAKVPAKRMRRGKMTLGEKYAIRLSRRDG
jgi:three-Cys-motif partner protein